MNDIRLTKKSGASGKRSARVSEWRRWLWMVCLSVICARLAAQDAVPATCKMDSPLPEADEMRPVGLVGDTIHYQPILPGKFQLYASNDIIDRKGVLDPIWERLRQIRASHGSIEDTLRVIHVGDSHIRGHIYPRATGELFTGEFAAATYTDFGINGATCATFLKEDRLLRIEESKADLIILSFGTNESHNRRYDARTHYRQMDELLENLRLRMPDVPILLTTPPGSYDRYWVRKKRQYRVNPRTEKAAETIVHFAADHGLAVWDMYALVGGLEHACANWQSAHLMRPDHIHYLAPGYTLQGSLFFQAIVNAYNSYVTR